VSELRAALADPGLFVYLTDLEGLGSGALLAMSAGVAVLASRVGGLVEVVEDGLTGVLVANEAGAVAEAMQQMMRDPERRRQMGLRGRERVAQQFTVDRMQSETMKVYEEVLA
jgi:starch synthase